VNLEKESRKALVVATAHYSDPKLQQLRAPAADAERLAAVLRDPDTGNFDVDVLIDETHGTVTRRIATFFRDRGPADLLLLHFSCHGVKDERGALFLAAADTEIDLLSATGVSAAWLNEQIGRTRSRRTVVLLDCCFSGSFPFGLRPRGLGVDAPEQLQGRGRAIITASSAMEYAYEGDQLTGEGQPSIFTAAVVEGLETGMADLDHDQLVSVDDLYNYVYDRVKEVTPGQTPNKKSDLEGPLYLARSSYRPPVEPATLDPDLVARTEDRYAGIREGAVRELAELLHARDPAVALAASELLVRMTGDDSRRVSAAAEAALAEAEPTAPAALEPAPPDPAAPKPARPEPVPREPSRQRFRPDRRLAIPLVILVLVAAGFLILRPDGVRDEGGEQSGAGSTPSSVSTGVPTTLSCPPDPTGWLKTDHGAQRHLECEVPGPPSGFEALSYGEFADAEQAHMQFDDGVRFHTEQGADQCPAAARQRMREVFTAGRTACFRDKYLFLWWNGDRSPVWGSLTFAEETKTEDAVAEWEDVVTTA
jgi:Caspase domain